MTTVCSVTTGTMTTVEDDDFFIDYTDDDGPKLVLAIDTEHTTPPLGVVQVRRLRDALNLWLAEHDH